MAESQSSLLNTAYKTLSSPVLRAEYLLSLGGYATLETDQLENQDLIMEVMEAREELEDLGSEDDVEELRKRNQGESDIHMWDNPSAGANADWFHQVRVSESLRELRDAFSLGDFERAKTASVRLKYWEGIEDAARAKLRDS